MGPFHASTSILAPLNSNFRQIFGLYPAELLCEYVLIVVIRLGPTQSQNVCLRTLSTGFIYSLRTFQRALTFRVL